MDREPTLLDDVFVGEHDDITFPCGRSLLPGEAITDATITCVRDHGAADNTPELVVATPRQVVGTDVVQRIANLQPGVWYRIRGLITLSSGRRLMGVAIVYGKAP